MLSQYKNIDQNQNAKSFSAERIDRTRTEFSTYDFNEAYYPNENLLKENDDSIRAGIIGGSHVFIRGKVLLKQSVRHTV